MMLNNYLKNGKLIIFPKKKKAKDEISKYMMSFFESNHPYTEQEVNDMIKNLYDDYAIIRRYLVDENYFQRSDDGSCYIKKDMC